MKVFENFCIEYSGGTRVALVDQVVQEKQHYLTFFKGFISRNMGKLLSKGRPRENMTVAQLRSSIALVPQETFLL